MKTYILFAAVIALGTGGALAQDTAPTTEAPATVEESTTALPAAADDEDEVPESIPVEMLDPGADEPLPLMPDIPYGPDPMGTGQLQKERAGQLREAIRIRELKIALQNDPELLAQQTLAKDAKTPEGRRTALRNYYTLQTKKLIARDKSLKETLEAQLRSQLLSLTQKRVYPTQPVEPIRPVPGSTLTAEEVEESRKGR